MRSPATVLFLISCFFVKFAQSQSNELIIQGQTGKLYLEHTVVAKENWYSIGRLYNVSPKEMAPFNHLTLGQTLIIGQTLQIPLTAVNFSQDAKKTPAETLVPLIYVVQEKEWMYRISVNHNKVPIPSLEKWNKMSKDQVRPGLHLIVGYLKVKTALSALAAASVAPAVADATAPAPASGNASSAKVAPAPTKVAPAPASGGAVPTNGAGDPPVTSKPAAAISHRPADTTSGPASLSSSGTATAAPTTAPRTTTAPPAETVSKPSPPPAPVVAPPTVASTPVATPPAAVASTPPAPHFNGGVFRGDFSGTGKSAGGQAGIFKSSSGWQDGKYYALMNNVAVGTIVKVSDASTGKSVYAKILGQLPDMKESAGLTIRLSNAAAAEMGESDGRFNVEVGY